MASTNTQSVLLPGSLYLRAGDEILVPVSYQVSGEDGSLELSGLGGVVLFDPSQLEFLGYEAAFSTDLFQAPASAYTEEDLVVALTKAGKSVAADLDGVPDTLAGVPFAYLSGIDATFDGDSATEWDGNPNWPGSAATDALSDSGLKLFSLRFKALEGFSGSPLTTVVTTTASGYNGAGIESSVILNTDSVVSGGTTGSGDEDSAITGTLTATDVEGLSDGTVFSIADGNGPANGSASIDPATGAWSYTPNANYNGSDAFTVTVTDDLNGTTTQEITVTVNAVDDATVIAGNTSGSGDEDASAITGTLSATDVEGLTDGTIFSIADGNGPANGTASIDTATGKWSYTPKANYNGTDAFTVTVTDDLNGTTTREITVRVNAVDDAAAFAGDRSGSGDEDSAITGTLNATDVEGLTDGTIFSIADGNGPANGTASIDPATGAWSYTPNANYNGSDAFTVTVTDDAGGTTAQEISVTVNAVDDAAVITGGTSGTGDEDSTISGTLTATDVEGLTDGTIFSIADGNGPANGTAQINKTSGAWIYTPEANFNGNDTFTATIADDLNGTTPQQITVTVAAVDDPTVVTGGTTSSGTLNGAPITRTLAATDIEGLQDGRVYSIADGNGPKNGTAEINAATGAWTYTPGTTAGSDTFTVTITDDADNNVLQKVLIIVDAEGANDPSVIDGNFKPAGDEDTTITGQLTAQDPDGLSTDTIYTIKDQPTHGLVSIDPTTGNWFYTPNDDYVGNDQFTITVTDSETVTTDSDPIVVTINPADDLAIASSGASGTGLKGNNIMGTLVATDVDGAIVSYVTSADPSYGRASIDADGQWQYTPAADYVGTDAFTVAVTDERGGITPLEIKLTVNPLITDEQQVSLGSADTISYTVGTDINIPLNYTTSNDEPNLTGLSLNVHYNSAWLTPSGNNNGISGEISSTPISSSVILDDTENLDSDESTDKIIQLNWASQDATFPGGTLPATLATLNFTTSKQLIDPLSGQLVETKLNLTSDETASNYSFVGDSVLVKPNFSFDVDGDGSASAESDGLIILRKLFGVGFSGDALIEGALGSAASRSSADEIHSWLEMGIEGGALDVDRDGETTALGDGLMILRHMSNMEDETTTAITNKTISSQSPYFGISDAEQRISGHIDQLLTPSPVNP